MRVVPRAAVAIGTGLLYGPIFAGFMIASGVKYPVIAASADSLMRSVLVPDAVLGVLLVILVTRLGWWRELFRDDRRAPRWLLVVPVVFGLALVGGVFENLAALMALDRSFLLAVLVTTLAVGFCEELTYRGIAVVGLRGALPEWQVWLVSTLLFALLHGWNFPAGQDLAPTLFQMAVTFGIGSIWYACRRATGGLVVCMVFHATYDFVILTTGSGVLGIAVIVLVVVFAVGAVPLFRHDARQGKEMRVAVERD